METVKSLLAKHQAPPGISGSVSSQQNEQMSVPSVKAFFRSLGKAYNLQLEMSCADIHQTKWLL